ncbi:hypothetical protein GCM10020000_62240 [Streptomyces olivoverticillatus]
MASRGGVKVASTAPSSAPRTVAVGSIPAKVAPWASGLAVTTIFSMSSGTAEVSTVIASGEAPLAARCATPGPLGWL